MHSSIGNLIWHFNKCQFQSSSPLIRGVYLLFIKRAPLCMTACSYMSMGNHLYTPRYEHTNMYMMKRSCVAAGAGIYTCMPSLKVYTYTQIHTHAAHKVTAPY